jgi:aspartate aminotransferase-like enzyme
VKKVFQTSNDIIFYPSSGSGVLESCVANTLSPGDKVLGISIGSFGRRFRDIARRFGANVTEIDFEPGSGADASVVAETLKKSGPFKAVLLTHNETSTGVTNDVEAVAKVVKPTGALLFVDAVSSLGAIDLKTDAWGVDCVATGSQKALMLPPGMGLVSISPAAWEAHRTSTMPRFYWDWTIAMDYQKKGENPYTPPVSLYYGLKRSLQLIEQEGLQNIFRRHEELAAYVRGGMQAMGLKLFAKPEWASTVVTAVWSPEGIDSRKILQVMEDDYNVILAGGQENLAGKIFRVGHMGYVHKPELVSMMECLREGLAELGYKAVAGVAG